MAEVKKRGRPPLSPEKKAESLELRKIYEKKYRSAHPEIYKGRYYEPKIRVPISNKEAFLALLDETGLSLSELCFDAIKEKYGIDFSVIIDK